MSSKPLDNLPDKDLQEYTGEQTSVKTADDSSATIEHVTTEAITPQELFDKQGLDPAEFRIASSSVNQRTGWSKLGPQAGNKIITLTVHYCSIKVVPVEGLVTTQIKALRSLIEQLKENSLAHDTPSPATPPLPGTGRRELEIAIMDPHFGLHCHTPASDQDWDLETCRDTMWWAMTSLLEQAEPYGPFERIVVPIGNDFMHADNVQLTTTGGTPQPEMCAYQHAYKEGLWLLISMVNYLAEIAPVQLYMVPGNHDRITAYTLGLALDAYFHNTAHVNVDASASPYKFHRFGCNLIGYEHGHSVNALRLGNLMANEVPEDWAATAGGYREWHLGDQHRKGSSKPSTFEEQGVSIEYLPALTPPNEWHRLKGFNWQKRGSMAYVWDHDTGPVTRFIVNMDNRTGKPLTHSAPKT